MSKYATNISSKSEEHIVKEQLLVTIDPRIKRQFKAAVAREGTNMTAATEALLQLYVSGDAKELIKRYEESLEEPTPA